MKTIIKTVWVIVQVYKLHNKLFINEIFSSENEANKIFKMIKEKNWPYWYKQGYRICEAKLIIKIE